MQLVASLTIFDFYCVQACKVHPWKVPNLPVSYRRDKEKRGRDTEMHGLVSLVIGKHAMYKVCAERKALFQANVKGIRWSSVLQE